MLLPLDRPYSVVAVPPVQGQAPLPGASVHKIAGVGEHTPATIVTTAAFRRSPGATSGLVIVKTDCISGSAYKVSGHPPLERVSCAPRAAPCAAASAAAPAPAGTDLLPLVSVAVASDCRTAGGRGEPLRHVGPPLLGSPEGQGRIHDQGPARVVPHCRSRQ